MNSESNNSSSGAMPPEIRVLERSDRISLYRKVNALRADMMKCDWSDDKYMSYGTSGYKYLSTDKILKTVSPLIATHGLELDVVIDDLTARPPVGSKEQHWTIRATVSLVDIDTGAADSSVVYAEAADNADMGLRKAHTMAIKQWILSKFLIADGIEDFSMPQGSGFKPRSPEEQEEAKSKVLAMGTKPTTPVGTDSPTLFPKASAKKEEKKEEKPAAKPAEAKKKAGDAPALAEAPKAEEKPAAKPAEMQIGPMKLNGYVAKLPEIRRKMIVTAATACAGLHDAGAMPDEDYDRMLQQLELIESLQDARTFTSLYADWKGAN